MGLNSPKINIHSVRRGGEDEGTGDKIPLIRFLHDSLEGEGVTKTEKKYVHTFGSACLSYTYEHKRGVGCGFVGKSRILRRKNIESG